jgi:hypothetical protein
MARFGRAISAGTTKEGDVIPGIAPAISTSSFRDAPLGAGPDSITPAGSMDSGFVLRTPRNDEGKFPRALPGQTIQISNLHSQPQLRDLAARRARVLLQTFRLLKIRGRRATPRGEQGMPGARCARSRAWCVESTRVSHHGHAGSPGIPRAMVLTVSFVLSPVTGLVCHRRQRKSFPPT